MLNLLVHHVTSRREKVNLGDWLVSRPDRFTSREGASGSHLIGGILDPIADLDVSGR